MNTSLLSKIIAIGLLSTWGFAFSHLLGMGLLNPFHDCPHAQKAHELCKKLLTMPATDTSLLIVIFTTFVAIVPLNIVVELFILRFATTFIVTENKSPPLYQDLYSRGTLNPKVP